MDNSQSSIPFWSDPKKRGYFFQGLVFVAVGLFVYFLYHNTMTNLKSQNIASGFSFLEQEAGFEISESFIEYWSDDTYQRALLAGFLNTLKVALIGNFFAIILGILIGISRLSSNWLLSRVSLAYIESLRNIPLLLQLFFWYALFSEIFPGVKEAWQLIPGVFLSQRGMVLTVFSQHPIWNWVIASFFISILFILLLRALLKSHQQKTGKFISPTLPSLAIFLGLPLLVWLVGGAPTQLDIPSLQGFNFEGGYTLSPEFLSLILGLVLYTAAFNAEIVRAGILSVKKGQWEASFALGLDSKQTMGLVILPQALRVIIPPMTSQMLNLTKNSSLAVAIGFPDFVSIANTTMNQTGQAVEAVALIMMVYLIFSLSTSLIMNIYNRSISLRER